VYDVQDQVRRAVKDFVIIGHGWAKTVWVSEEKDVEFTEQELQQVIQMALQQKQQALAASPNSADLFPSDDELIKSVPKSRPVLVKDQPDVTRVSPFDMFVDPDAKVLEAARWIAQRFFVPIETARKNKDWNEKTRKSLAKVNISKAREMVTVEAQNEQSNKDGFVEIYEFYDLVEGTMCVFAEGSSGFLLDPVESPFKNGHPYEFLENYEVPEKFYPTGDVETIFPLQLELAIARTAQINDRKRGRRITLFREAALGSDGIEALRAGQDNVMIPVLSKDTPFNDVFMQVSSLGLQPEWYRADGQAMDDINVVSGVSEYARGGSSDIRRTATEVGVTQDYANARSADKLAKVERFMANIAERMILLTQEFMDGEDVARVVSDSQAVEWVPYNRDRLKGSFTFKVEAGSTQPQNESFRLQQAARMMEAFGPLIGSGFLNDQEFLAQIMRMNGWNDVDKFLGPGPQPMPPEQGGPPEQSEMAPPPQGGMPPQSGMPPQGGAPGQMPPM